jgi:hypothetical protein
MLNKQYKKYNVYFNKMSISKKLPIEIINKILVYIAELNGSVIIQQYNKNGCFYKINFCSDFFWDLKGLILTKRFYPIIHTSITNNSIMELYKFAKTHYTRELKNKKSKT